MMRIEAFINGREVVILEFVSGGCSQEPLAICYFKDDNTKWLHAFPIDNMRIKE